MRPVGPGAGAGAGPLTSTASSRSGGVQPRAMEWGDSALTAPTSPARRSVAVDRSKVDPKIVEAGEGMEAMFLDYMMKVMRETVPKGEMDLENPATGIYRGMLDNELAQKAVKSGGIGLADQVIAYLDSQRYNLPMSRNGSGKAPAAAGENSTGGTDERIQSRK